MPPKKLEQKLKDPRLTLFAFHLQHDITQDFQKGAKDAAQLWLRCADLGEKLGIDQLKSLPKLLKNSQPNLASQQPHLELLQPQRVLTFQANPQSDNAYLAGEAYPVQLHDTYAPNLTLHYVETTVPVEVDDLNQLNPKGGLLPCQIQASLRQTLLLFAQLTQIPCDYRILADNCVKALLKDVDDLCPYSINKGQLPCISRVAEGQLFSSPIFEYDIISGGLKNPIAQCHILVWLNRYPEKNLPLAKKGSSLITAPTMLPRVNASNII